MGEMCNDCRKWEEEMYWTHFQSMHFCQFLHGDFVQELTIPKKFANNLKDKLPETVTLKGPSGATWNVGLTTSGDALVFKNGWKEFVENHSLLENDVLIFTYDGNSHFDVLMFDRGSLCERECSYFVRKCGHTRLVIDEGQTMRKVREKSVEVVHDDEAGCISSGQGNISLDNREIWKEAHGSEPLRAKLRSKGRDPPTSADAGQNSINRIGAYQLQYVSNRRPVSREEKEKALLKARAALTSESFIVVMRPTHVYKRFYMAIPSEWVASHLSRRKQDMILRFRENSWCVTYNYSQRGGGGVYRGWKDFALENNLEEFDVCLFEYASRVDDTVVMDVSIYRAVEEVTPPTRAYPSSSRRGMPSTRVYPSSSRRGRPSKIAKTKLK